MYLLKPLDPSCTGPTPEELADVLAGKLALDSAVANANAAIWQNTSRPELNSRGLLLADELPANKAPNTPGPYLSTPARYARVLLSDVPVCVRSQAPTAYHSRQAGLAGLRHHIRGMQGLADTAASLPAALKADVAGIPVWMLAAGALGAVLLLRK